VAWDTCLSEHGAGGVGLLSSQRSVPVSRVGHFSKWILTAFDIVYIMFAVRLLYFQRSDGGSQVNYWLGRAIAMYRKIAELPFPDRANTARISISSMEKP